MPAVTVDDLSRHPPGSGTSFGQPRRTRVGARVPPIGLWLDQSAPADLSFSTEPPTRQRRRER